jgi:molybdopterin synthase catalytic subunit
MPTLLTRDTLDPADLTAAVAADGMGGAVVFLGTVRRSAEDGDVVGIEYSAYEPMAVAESERIIAEAVGRWPAVRVAIRHRLGFVPTGAASVVVVAAAPHRDDAFAACRYVIDQTKRRVPIWKKEHFASGKARWVEGHVPLASDATPVEARDA